MKKLENAEHKGAFGGKPEDVSEARKPSVKEAVQVEENEEVADESGSDSN